MPTNEQSPAHTPLPWIVPKICSHAIRDQKGNPIAASLADRNSEADANAAFIVRACNAYADLLKLARDYREACSTRIDLLEGQLADEHEFSGDATEIRDQIAHWKAARKNCDTVLAKAHGIAA